VSHLLFATILLLAVQVADVAPSQQFAGLLYDPFASAVPRSLTYDASDSSSNAAAAADWMDRMGEPISKAVALSSYSSFDAAAMRFKAKAASTLQFLAIGDWGCKRKGGATDQNQKAVADAMASSGYDPSFIMSLGDNFYEHGVKSTEDKRWSKVFEEVYSARNLQKPWFSIVGNHDWRAGAEGVQSQVDYTAKSPTHRWWMKYTYYQQRRELADGTKVLMLFLDTTKIIDGDPPQIAWLEKVLANAGGAQWVIVAGHHPIISASDHGNLPEMMQHVYPLLQKYHVDIYIAGHDHVVEHLKDMNVNYYVCGSGCKLGTMQKTSAEFPQLQFGGATLGFCGFEISRDEVNAKIISSTGKLLYENAVPRRRG